MPTYVYEVIANESDAEPRRFEVFQRMSEAPLKFDPVSGAPVRKIITGGSGIRLQGLKRSTVVNKKSAAATACACASGSQGGSHKGHKHAGHSSCSH